MKLLVVICAHEFNVKNCENIKILNDFMQGLINTKVDYCGISNIDDFHNYESIIQFKYKLVNTKRQFGKLCDFITDNKSELDYDWYIKFRPDVKLLTMFDFDTLSDKAINARARVYRGPKKIKYGMSINGQGCWINIGDYFYDETEKNVILDDMMFIFHHNIIKLGAFDKITHESFEYAEWKLTSLYIQRNIELNVIGIHLENTKYRAISGDIPPSR